MLKINCLLDTPSIKQPLEEMVGYVGYSLLDNGKKADIYSVYQSLRKLGVEVDMQTASHIYEEVFDTTDTELFSDVKQIEEAREQTFRNIASKTASIGLQEIGSDSPSVSVAASIAKLLEDVGKRNPTAQKELEQGLKKAANRVMEKNRDQFPKQEKGKESLEDILNRVLRSEQNRTVSIGEAKVTLNTAKELFDQFQEDMNTLADKFEDKDTIQADKIRQYAYIINEAAYDLFISQGEINKVITDVLTEAGYTKEISSEEGTRKVIDWNKVLGSSVDFKETLNNVLIEKGFTQGQVNKLTDTLTREFNSLRAEKIKKKLTPKETFSTRAARESDIDKLVSLNNMGIFENANKKELYKLLGVSDLDAAAAQSVKNIAEVLKTLNPQAQNSPTVVKTLQRQIEIELNKIQDQDTRLKIAQGFARFSQWSNGLLISNIGNVIENTSSGLLQLISTAVTNPKTAVRYIKGAFNVLQDVMGGGVREGINYSDAFSASLNVGDEFNLETAKTFKGKVLAYANLLTRATLESIDSAVKNATTNIMFANSLENILVSQGVSRSDAQTIINETLYGNNAEINKLADEMVSQLVASGVNITFDEVKKKRIRNELARANILSNGQFFQNVVEDLITRGEISGFNSKFKGINDDVFNGVLQAAEASASKGLGHVSDNWAFQEIFDNPARRRQKNIKEARKAGDKGQISKALWAGTLNSVLNRYVGGAARWSWLTLEKLSGISLLQTLITDVAGSGFVKKEGGKGIEFKKELMGKYLQFDKLSQNFETKDAKGKQVREDGKSEAQYELEKYLSLRERLKRQIVGPIVGYTVAAAILPKIADILGFGFDDDDDDETKAEKSIKMSKWLHNTENSNVKAVINKIAPIQLMSYYNSLSKNDLYGNVVDIQKEPNNDILKTYFNAQVLRSLFIDNFNRGATFEFTSELLKEEKKKDGNIGKVFINYGLQLANLNTAFKFYDINKNLIDGFKQKPREKLTQPKDNMDAFMKYEFTRQMYKDYMENKSEQEE